MDELPTDAFYDLTRPASVAVSPDGDRVAFQAAEYDPDEEEKRSSVFTVPADGSRDPYRLTRVSDASAMKWSPDGSKLGVLMAREQDVELQVGRDEDEATDESDSEDDDAEEADGDAEEAEDGDDEESAGGNGGEGPKPQLWVYDMERGGDARQVTDRDEGVRDFDWGPDGERVVVAARDPTEDEQEYLERRRDDGPIEVERLQHKFDGAGWLDDVTTYLFVVDVDSREERRLDDAYAAGIFAASAGPQPVWHPEREEIAFLANHGENPDNSYAQDVHVVDAQTGDVETITDGEYTTASPRWSPDGSRLAFVASDPENWYVPDDACVYDTETGEYHTVTDGLDRGFSWFGHPVWIDDDRLLASIGDDGWTRFVRVDADGGVERVGDWQSREEAVHQFHVDADTLAFVRTHPREGADLYAGSPGDLDAAGARRLTALNPDLTDEYEHPETERVTFEGAEGDEVEGIAFYPPEFDPETPDGDRPLLLWIHGGPMSYDEPRFDFDTTFWTTRGYVVFKVNYHGSTSYGREFCERLKGEWNTVEVEDLLAGTEELVDRGWVDPDRLFVGGFSQGGVNTAYVVTKTDRFAAGVAEHGVYDMRSAFGTDDSHKWWENDFGLPWENPEAYDAASSIDDVDAIDTPLMLTAGENDWRCPPTQAEQLYVSLQKRGVDSKLVVYTDEHHNIGDPDRAIHRLEALEAWFERHDPAVETDDESDER